jgi:hypothetical protein
LQNPLQRGLLAVFDQARAVVDQAFCLHQNTEPRLHLYVLEGCDNRDRVCGCDEDPEQRRTDSFPGKEVLEHLLQQRLLPGIAHMALSGLRTWDR